MRAFKIIVSVLLTLLSLALVAFAGFFLWGALPKKEAAEPPAVLDTDAIFAEEPEEPPVPAEEPALPAVEPDIPAEVPDEPEPAAEAPTEEPPEDTAEEEAAAKAQAWLDSMSLEEKVWQLFITTPESLTGYTRVTLAGDATKAAIAEKPVGGLCYFAANLVDREQTLSLLGNVQTYAKTKLFLCVDEEGGLVSRAGSNEALGVTHFEAAQVYGQRADMAEVYNVGKTMAQELGELGFNLDFAPVADVITNPNNTEIGSRSYSKDPTVAAAMVSAMVEGLQRNGMISCLKHFPGHGSTETDSHEGKSVSTRTLDELRETEWLPFETGIAKGVAFVMVSHLTNENLSNLPADLSPEVMGYLRDELGFTGIIITDSHQMGAITSYYTSGEATVLALQAGVDMVLMPQNLEESHQAVLEAIENGALTEDRINESVLRILTVKYQFGILE